MHIDASRLKSIITLRVKLSGAVYFNRFCLRRAGVVRTLLHAAHAQCLRLSERFLGAMRNIERIGYGQRGWVGGWLSQPVLYQNDKTYLKTFQTIW